MRSWRSRFPLISALILLLWGGGSPCQAPGMAGGHELYRIRVRNATGGAVEVSGDGGFTYARVGRVVRPATQLMPGFPASRWAPPGSVAAVAVYGLRLKVREALIGERDGVSNCMLMSLVPREFQFPPKGYGGHLPGASGIYTDIPAGEGIFRNLCPLVGNPVRLVVKGQLMHFPEDYPPRIGDTLEILVLAPPAMPREIVFENWKGGQVTALFDNRAPQPIARVNRPVRGVGRYDGTTFTGVGRINTNHSGVITISTVPLSGSQVPEGEGDERRGGIQIEPVQHAGAVSPDSDQTLVVEPLDGREPLEGKPPLFSGYIGLFWSRRSEAHTAAVEVKIDNGPWEPMPEISGRVDDAFTATGLTRYFRSQGLARSIGTGVTHLRLVFPRLDRASITRLLAEYPSGGKAAGALGQSVHGIVTVSVALKNIPDQNRVSIMTVHVDGRTVAILNVAPYQHDLDTRRLPNGAHELELRALDRQGEIVAQRRMTIMVDNPPDAGGAG